MVILAFFFVFFVFSFIFIFFLFLLFSFRFSQQFCHKGEKKEDIKIRKKKVLSHPASNPGPSGFILYTLPTELDILDNGLFHCLPVLFNSSPLCYCYF